MTENVKKFCSQCGTENKNGKNFCTHCGASLIKTAVSTVEPTEAAVLSSHEQQDVKAVKKVKKAPIILGAVLAFLVILAGAGYFFGNQYFSKNQTFSRYTKESNKAKGKLDQLLSWYSWSDSKKPLQKSDLTYLTNAKDSDLEGVSFEKTGTSYLIFPHYQFVVKPVNLTINSNISNLTYSVDGKSLKNKEKAVKLSHLLPANYKLTAQGSLQKQEVKLSKVVTVTLGSQAVNFKIDSLSFKVKSNMSTGDVYLNTVKIGSLKKGQASFKEIPLLPGSQLYVEQKYPDGLTKSETKAIESVKPAATVVLDNKQLFTTAQATTLLTSAASDLTSYGENASGKIPAKLATLFDGGEKNEIFLAHKAEIDHNLKAAKRKASTVSYSDVKVKALSQTGKASYMVDFTVKVTCHYTAATDPKGHSSGNLYQVFECNWSVKADKNDNYLLEKEETVAGTKVASKQIGKTDSQVK